VSRLDDSGNAIVEFVWVAVLIMVPLLYLMVAVADLQRSQLAVTDAAREAGRAYATSDTAAQASVRVPAAVRIALADQRVPDDAAVRFVAAADRCSGPPVVPTLTPGSEFAVCVTRRTVLPAVPTWLAGHAVTTVGRYLVHVDDFRTAP
jgi:Flp pilus assembly protein TadG